MISFQDLLSRILPTKKGPYRSKARSGSALLCKYEKSAQCDDQVQNNVVNEMPKDCITLSGYLKSKLKVMGPIFPN